MKSLFDSDTFFFFSGGCDIQINYIPHDKKSHLSDHHLTDSLFCDESNIAPAFISVVYNDVVILFLYDGRGNELSRSITPSG